MFNCRYCSFETCVLNSFVNHSSSHMQEGCSIPCPVECCASGAFVNHHSFKRHCRLLHNTDLSHSIIDTTLAPEHSMGEQIDPSNVQQIDLASGSIICFK